MKRKRRRLDRLRCASSRYFDPPLVVHASNALFGRHVRFFPTASSFLAEDQSIPRVILAVPYNFSHGPSRKLFTTFAQEPGNLIILTAMSESKTLGDELFNLWNAKQSEEDKWGKGRVGEVIRTGKMLSVRVSSKRGLAFTKYDDLAPSSTQKYHSLGKSLKTTWPRRKTGLPKSAKQHNEQLLFVLSNYSRQTRATANQTNRPLMMRTK